METENIAVIDDKIKQDKNGKDYANVKLDDGRFLNFFGDDFEAYKGPGDYTAILKRNGKYWNIEAGSLRNISGASNGSNTQEAGKEAHKPFMRDLDTNKSILIQTCIKAAADVYHGTNMVEAGHGLVVGLADKFFKFAEKALKPVKKEELTEEESNDVQE